QLCDIQTDGCNLHSGPILFPDDFQQLHRGPLRGRLKGDGSIPLSIEWLFDVDKARNKLHRAYDELTIQN
ncbi:hypothetical protein, partial [Shewanella algae]|uniref:hypothetical protein n=1 Tax=Shewanella algae TaxID=38313 RepID=UPI003AAD2987